MAVAETCRHHVDAYGAWVHGLKPARHHRIWVEKIMDLVEGRSAKRRLLIIAPPGHAKSTWISLIFPAWYLGNHPDHAILFYTSAKPMANQFDTAVTHTLEQSERHRVVFPDPKCRPDESRGWSSDGRYLLGVPDGVKDPSYRAIGYGSASIGSRAHGIILDDPLTQEDAQSETVQGKARTYFDMTVDSRLHPEGWMLAITTIWHEGDLGNFLKGKPDWDVVHMPALKEPPEEPYPWGSALWPERFSEEFLVDKRASIGSPQFNCMYQGDPTGMGGDVFQDAKWFRPLPSDFDEPRSDGLTFRQRLRIVQFWDTAFSEMQSADYSACCTIGVDASNQIYVLNVFRDRLTPAQIENKMVELIGSYRPLFWGVELPAFKQKTVADIMQRVTKRVIVNAVAVPVDTDKVTRARLPAGRAELGLVYADRAAPWYPAFEAECLGFPKKEHDDQVDALSGAVAMAAQRLGPVGTGQQVRRTVEVSAR